jgi:hypothetical protein
VNNNFPAYFPTNVMHYNNSSLQVNSADQLDATVDLRDNFGGLLEAKTAGADK